MCLSPEVYGDLQWPPSLRSDIYHIYRSSRHLLDMIDDILDLARSEILGPNLRVEPTSVEHLVKSAAEIASGLFLTRPISLEVSIEPDLPVVNVDSARIRQVILNLIRNAATFTDAGSVCVEAKQRNGEIIISVHDTGIGIPPDELSRLFQEFHRVEYPSGRQVKGFGLGLAISKRFVEAHGGRIWAENEVGVSSVFLFALPLRKETVPLMRLGSDHDVAQPCASDARPVVLVIDSDPVVASLIRRYLEEYEVVQVKSMDCLSSHALEMLHPQAIIHNVRPNELSACNDVRHTPVPYIRCSLPSHSWIEADLAVKRCLPKPIQGEQLVR